jgi:hypothetical protein
MKSLFTKNQVWCADSGANAHITSSGWNVTAILVLKTLARTKSLFIQFSQKG